MKGFEKKSLLFLLLGCFFFLCSCGSNDTSDGRHPIFIKAESLYNEGKINESYFLYEKYLQLNPKSAKASYRLALISQDRGDFVKAIYYYEKYLELDPNSSDREIIEKWIIASKKSLVKEITKQDPIIENVNTSDSIINPNTEILQLKEKNEELVRQLRTLQAEQKNISDTLKQQNAPLLLETQRQNSKVYVVEEGDNLYKISKKFYGSNKYYKQILEANKDKLKGSSSIKLGDKLIIPHIEEN